LRVYSSVTQISGISDPTHCACAGNMSIWPIVREVCRIQLIIIITKKNKNAW